METIQKYLMDSELHLRISNGSKWLYYDNDSERWVVLNLPFNAKKIRILYRGNNIEEAMKQLVNN